MKDISEIETKIILVILFMFFSIDNNITLAESWQLQRKEVGYKNIYYYPRTQNILSG